MIEIIYLERELAAFIMNCVCVRVFAGLKLNNCITVKMTVNKNANSNLGPCDGMCVVHVMQK